MDSRIRQQYYGLDVAKLIAAVFVIASHTHPLARLGESLFYNVYAFFQAAAVPFFALSSGYLLSRKLQWAGDSKEDIQILKKTLFNIIRLYLIWNLIHLPIAIQEPVPDGKPVYLIIARYVINFFFVGEQYLSWQFWYLLAYIYGTVLLLLLRKWNGKAWLLGVAAFALYWLSFWMYQFTAEADAYTGAAHMLSLVLGEVFVNGRLIGGVSYILAGAFLGRLSRTPGLIPCSVLLMTGFFLNLWDVLRPGTFLRYLLAPACAVFLFLMCLRWKGTQPKALCLACRSTSTVFYFTHMFWFYVGYVLLDPFPSFTYWGAPSFFWCLLCSGITAVLVIKFPDSKLVKCLF